jgi:transcriptional regulator with XRE-family HTH domain
MSKSELVRRAGVSRPLLDRYLRGEIPGQEPLEAILRALGAPPQALFDVAPDADESELLRLFRQAPDDDARQGIIRIVQATLGALAPRAVKKKGEAG